MAAADDDDDDAPPPSRLLLQKGIDDGEEDDLEVSVSAAPMTSIRRRICKHRVCRCKVFLKAEISSILEQRVHVYDESGSGGGGGETTS